MELRKPYGQPQGPSGIYRLCGSQQEAKDVRPELERYLRRASQELWIWASHRESTAVTCALRSGAHATGNAFRNFGKSLEESFARRTSDNGNSRKFAWQGAHLLYTVCFVQ